MRPKSWSIIQGLERRAYIRVEGLGFRVWGLGLRLRLRVSGVRVLGFGDWLYGSACRARICGVRLGFSSIFILIMTIHETWQ